MTKKILFVTGTRADFGKLKSLMTRVETCGGFECDIFATGMHTLPLYGSTYNEIKKAGFKNIYLFKNQDIGTNSAMDMVLATTVQGLGRYVREDSPDLIVVHGDRVEALAGAIVGALNNILVAHIEGGEISGTIDELIRHSVSKLSHVHFVSNEEARDRLIQMGEEPDSIFVIGSPDIDIMLSDGLPPLSEAKKWYGIDFDRYCFFIYHPVTTELKNLKNNVHNVVSALISSGLNFIIIYPNNDTGSDVILEELDRLRNDPHFKIFPSVRFEYFLTLLKNSQAIVGNSSSGIREAPVYGIPTINIGSRQNNRYKCTSIINVLEDYDKLLKILRGIPTQFPPSYMFGNGDSSKLFLNTLRDEKIWKINCQKQFRDIQK